MPIAEALVEGGLPVLEVTLRTPAALDVQHYLVPVGAPGSESAMHEGAHPVSPAKIAAPT